MPPSRNTDSPGNRQRARGQELGGGGAIGGMERQALRDAVLRFKGRIVPAAAAAAPSGSTCSMTVPDPATPLLRGCHGASNDDDLVVIASQTQNAATCTSNGFR